MVNIDYIQIGQIGTKNSDGFTVWVAKPWDIDLEKKTFFTHTMMFGDSKRTHYDVEEIKNAYNTRKVTAKKNMHFYVYCERHEADFALVPYYMGTDFKPIIRHLGGNLFLIRERIGLDSKTGGERDNEILKVIYKEHRPTADPQYKEDCDTVCDIYNPDVKFIKQIFVS